MPVFWRLTKAKHARTALSGYGSLRRSGRWHRQGVPMVYAAESPALALLETIVHVEATDLLSEDYVAVRIDAADSLVETLGAADLPEDWRAWPWPLSTQRIGTRFMETGATPVLCVPSSVVPAQSNYLLNPTHEQFGQLIIRPPEPFDVDPRLAR